MTRGLIAKLVLVAFTVNWFAVSAALAQYAPGPPAGFWNTPTGGGGGSGAPDTAQYVTLINDAGLTNERTLSVTSPITLVDGGANNPVTLAITNSLAGGLTGATTQQGAANSILNFAGKAAGDFVTYDGANWSRLAKGSNGDYLQMIAGVPTWQAATAGAGTGVAFVTVGADATLSAERAITAGTGILGTDGGANSTYTLAIDTTLVATTSNTLTLTNKSITDAIMTWNTGNGLRLNNSAGTASRLKWADFASARNYTIPDVSADANFVMTEGAQTINGVKTFGSAPVLSTGTITVGGNTITLPSTTDTLVTLAASQTLTNKTLTSPHIGTSLVLDQTTANYTLTWANPAAARALRIQDMSVDTDLLQKAQSQAMTAGGVLVGDGTKVGVTAAGTTGQVLKSNGSSAPTWGGAGTFGGNGADGAVTISSNTVKSTTFQYNATTVQINNSCTLTLHHESVINASSSVIVGQGSSGAIVVGQEVSGALVMGYASGISPGASDTSRTVGFGGGGGGSGGIGGNGGGTSAVVMRGGNSSNQTIIQAGSGGGAGGANNGGPGGNGGGRLTICALDAITIAAGATITADGLGGSGGTSSAGGGGGGSGGTVLLASQASVTNNGTIFTRGGTGGNGNGTGGGGGGGGGGQIVFWSPSNTTGTCTQTGGTAGTGGTTTATNGTGGDTLQIVGTPNLPLLGWAQNNLDKLCALPAHNLKQRDVAALAADGDVVKYFAYMSGSLTETCEAIGDSEVLDNAA